MSFDWEVVIALGASSAAVLVVAIAVAAKRRRRRRRTELAQPPAGGRTQLRGRRIEVVAISDAKSTRETHL